MPNFIRRSLLFLAVSSLLLPYYFAGTKSLAAISSCTATSNLNQVASGSSNTFLININNTSSNVIVWIRFTRPSSNFTLGNIIASGWTKNLTTSQITITNGILDVGMSRNFTLTSVVAANVNAVSADWVVEVSDDPSGANPTSCTGSLGVQIGNPVVAPQISNVAVSNITSSSAIVSWTTDIATTSRVDYGLTSSYGSNVSDGTLVTNHSLNLTGLLESTGYHYQVTSADASNNSASSGDNTFLTPAKPIIIPPSTPSKPSGSLPTTTTGPQANVNRPATGDTIAPTVSLLTDFSKFYKQTPVIQGTATDNVAVISIDFSTDAGVNWLPVESAAGLNSRQVSFSFTPENLPDGNYPIIVRATDSSGNIGVSETKTLVLDNVLPVIGPAIVSVGPQIVDPVNNTITAVKNVDQKITLSTIGGPISVSIVATEKTTKIKKTFTLSKNISTNLWSGILAFGAEGNYSLEASAVDGANNKTSRSLSDVIVNATSIVVAKDSSEPINNAKVTLYSYDDETASWVVWDAASFGEQNPQNTNQKGEFNFYLPEGKYYLKVKAPMFSDLTTQIFVLNEGTNLSTNLPLNKLASVKLGSFVLSLPDLGFSDYKITFNHQTQGTKANSLLGQDLPDFALPSTSGDTVHSVDLLGKNSLITFVNTWDPRVEEQISQLEALSKNNNFNVVKISVLEPIEKLKAYKKIAGYNGDFLADETGSTLTTFNPSGLPYNIFVSRSGKVKNIINGVLTSESLIYNLEN